MIKVSIVVPVYNVEKYLEKCLVSLTEQTLREIEIIVVNDGSTDDSQKIIDRFVAKYPDKVRAYMKQNGGLSDARNYGISYCHGRYIGFVDSDDYVEKTMYEKMYEEALRIDADVVICDYIKEYSHTKEIVEARKYESVREMFIGGLAAAWNKIYRKSVIEAHRLEFPRGLIYEDTEFFCKLVPYVSKCGYVAEPMVHYVQRGGSIANTQGKKVAMIFQIFDNVLSYYKENGFLEIYRDELSYFIIRVLLGSSMERICRCSDRKIRQNLAVETIDYLDWKLPGWRRNPYLSNKCEKRNIYMKNVYKWNIKIVSTVFRKHFKNKEKNLLE